MRTTRPVAAALTLLVASGLTALAPAPQAQATDNTQTVYQYFRAKGLSGPQAAAITGNFMQESSPSINPRASQAGSRGRGIAQWEVGGRWDTSRNDNVTSYAQRTGRDRWSLAVQLDFTWYELATFPGYGLSRLKAQSTVEGATQVFCTYFEGASQPQMATRISYAQQVYQRNGGKVATLPVLQQGAQGTPVRTVQYALGTSPDGVFGPNTRSAVVAFQSRHGLAADGVVGPRTWDALLTTLQTGSRGNLVKALQAELRDAGYRLAVDGSFGSGTNAAVRAYQSRTGLAVDGVVGRATWTKLLTS